MNFFRITLLTALLGIEFMAWENQAEGIAGDDIASTNPGENIFDVIAVFIITDDPGDGFFSKFIAFALEDFLHHGTTKRDVLGALLDADKTTDM